jgi:phosphoserine aminotransferase
VTERIFNFSAGPAVLPEEVVRKVQENLYCYKDSGLGVMEMSHRGAEFTEIIEGVEKDLRSLLDISDDYAVVFSTGGATQQFSMVPMNILQKGSTAEYILTGAWAKKAAAEAKKFGEVSIAADGSADNFSSIPKELSLVEKSSYVHFTSNNTIFGTQYHAEPEVGDRVLVCDASSDFLHRKIDINKYGIVYAGAQKNIGPAGVTLVIIRKDLLERIPAGLPVMLDYRTLVENNSLYNTPPTFPIYVISEVLQWLESLGGLDAIYERNKNKASLLYSAIDAGEFYRAVVGEEDRSLMNVTFRLPSEELEKKFIEKATTNGLSGLKGHRSVGGIRASIYNAFPTEGVQALIDFMAEFEKTEG